MNKPEDSPRDNENETERLSRTNTIRRYWYTLDEVATHNSPTDCFVIIYGKVLDITPVLAQNHGPDVKCLLDNAGKDVSHWFDEFSGTLKTYVDPQTDLRTYYLPMGRMPHAPPLRPGSDVDMSFTKEGPWWRNKKYIVGALTKGIRTVRLINTLSLHEHVLSVPQEESLGEIMTRYLAFNKHAFSYTAKHQGRELDPLLTLEANGLPDETAELERLGMDPLEYIPNIHMYFIDDLSVD